MFSTQRLLSKENIFRIIDSYQIFKFYSQNFNKIGESFYSDFRKEDNASARVEHIGGDLLYTDFGRGSYRAIDFVMELYNLDFYKALSKINLDFRLGLIDDSKSKVPISKKPIPKKLIYNIKEKSTAIIDVKYRKYSLEDLNYWKQFGWTPEMLIKAKIYPISHYWLTMEHKGIIDKLFLVGDKLAYTYNFYKHEGIFRRKLYFPTEAKDRKFISNIDNTVVQGWPLLPRNGENLFITSSMKDIGPFWRLNGVCNSIAPNNEASFIPDEVYYYKIKPRFKNKYIWFDNDTTGIKNALKFARIYDLIPIWNPIGGPKDPSDWVKEYGLRSFNNLLKSKING